MATPLSEKGVANKGGQVKRLTEAFDSVPVNKKSRLSVATTNDTASLLGDDDGTDSLLNADEVISALQSCWNAKAILV